MAFKQSTTCLAGLALVVLLSHSVWGASAGGSRQASLPGAVSLAINPQGYSGFAVEGLKEPDFSAKPSRDSWNTAPGGEHELPELGGRKLLQNR